MTERVYLHVGAPKSGTTYLQGVLEGNRARLAEAGVLLVGDHHLDRIHAAMVIRQDRRLESLPERARTSWNRLVTQIREWQGPVAVLSYELLAGASAKQVRRALADLEGLDVHVVVTARDLAGSIPSAWQERLKFALTTPLEEWTPRPESAGPRAEWGWRTLDPSGVAQRWGKTLPADHVHIVTVPRGGAPERLWERFADALELHIDGLNLHPERSNTSLGLTAAEVLRRVNAVVADRLPGNREHAVWLRDTLAHGILAGLDDERIGATPAQVAQAQERSAVAVAAITKAGYAVHGDLADLEATASEARTPAEADEAEIARTAVAALGEALLLVRERTRERDRALGVAGEGEDGLIARGKRLVKGVSAAAVQRENDRLRERVEALEGDLHAARRLQLRVAELTDLVTELLLPAGDQDEAVTEQRLRDYRKSSL